MKTKYYAFTLKTASLASNKIESSIIQMSATDREKAIMKLFDTHLRYSFSVDIEELLKNNSTIFITLKEQQK